MNCRTTGKRKLSESKAKARAEIAEDIKGKYTAYKCKRGDHWHVGHYIDMKNYKFKVGETVKHTYAEEDVIGEVHELRDDPDGYNYFVRFVKGDDPIPVAKDWYKGKVLRHVEG